MSDKDKKLEKKYIARAGYAKAGNSPGNYAYKIKTSFISEEETEEYEKGQYSEDAEDVYSELIKGKRVAIVGPANILKGKGHGDSIDSYDTVIRMNGFFDIDESLVLDFGKKCDILYINGSTGKNAAYENQELLIYPKHAIGIRKSSHVLCYSIFPLDDWKERGLKVLSKMGVDDSVIQNTNGITVRKTRHFVAGTRFQMPDEDTLWKFKQLPLIGPTIIGEVLQYEPSEVYVTGFDFYINGISWADGYAGKVKRTGGHTYLENAKFMKDRIDEGRVKVDDDLMDIINKVVTKDFKYDEEELLKQGRRAMTGKFDK